MFLLSIQLPVLVFCMFQLSIQLHILMSCMFPAFYSASYPCVLHVPAFYLAAYPCVLHAPAFYSASCPCVLHVPAIYSATYPCVLHVPDFYSATYPYVLHVPCFLFSFLSLCSAYSCFLFSFLSLCPACSFLLSNHLPILVFCMFLLSIQLPILVSCMFLLSNQHFILVVCMLLLLFSFISLCLNDPAFYPCVLSYDTVIYHLVDISKIRKLVCNCNFKLGKYFTGSSATPWMNTFVASEWAPPTWTSTSWGFRWPQSTLVTIFKGTQFRNPDVSYRVLSDFHSFQEFCNTPGFTVIVSRIFFIIILSPLDRGVWDFPLGKPQGMPPGIDKFVQNY